MWRLFLGSCPHCDGRLKPVADHHECQGWTDKHGSHHECGVIVVGHRGGWRFPLESRLRALPGLAGLRFRATVEV